MIHKFSIETITPLMIGDGNTLSPLTDFFLARKKSDQSHVILYINHDVFNKELIKLDLLDKFISEFYEIQAKSNNIEYYLEKKNSFLLNFLTKKMGIKPIEVKKRMLDYVAPVNTNLTELKTIIKNGDGNAYIPGSSIKGAIKTAFLNNWLDTMPQLLDNFIDVCIKGNREREKEIRKKIIGEAHREFEQSIENELFGKLSTTFRNDFSLLQISDSELISSKSVAVYYTERLRLKASEQNAKKLPNLTEAINSEVKTTFELRVPESKTEQIKNDYLKFLNDEKPQKLLEHINQFSLACIEYEIEELEENDLEHLEEYRNHLVDINNEIIEAQKTGNTAILRLGSGKINFSNSIGLLIKKYYKESFKDYSEILRLSKRYDDVFPKTRTAEMKYYQPLGWIKLTHVETKNTENL